MKKILIAEDEKAISDALKLKLSHVGYEVSQAQDGEQALSVLQNGNIDLIILDLMMPKIDGFAVLEEIKKKNIKTPVIVATNLSQEEDEKRVLALGAKDYIVKSDTTLDEIIKRVQKIIG